MTEQVDVAALHRWLGRFAAEVSAQRERLTELDSAIGDADHGTNLARGMSAVVAMLTETPPTGPAALLKQTGMTLVSKVGGTSGPLYGTFFLRMATAAGDAGTLDAAAVARLFRAGLDGVLGRGKAAAGDKTMVDALEPAVEALETAVAAGSSLAEALDAAAAAAEAGRDATTGMLARKGRASYLGERSVGHQDPGATSMAMLITAAAQTLSAVDGSVDDFADGSAGGSVGVGR